MMALALLSALAAAAVLTWLHLRPAGRRRAVDIPSLQLLGGSSPRSRRALHLEEPAAWGLRVLSLLLALAGVWGARGGCAADTRPVAILDPAAPAEALEETSALTRAAVLLGFRGTEPVAFGDVALPVQGTLEACSDTRAACLLRAADQSGRPVVVAGPFLASEWRLALARRSRDFLFLRTAAGEATAKPADVSASPWAQVRLDGNTSAAQVWAAALAVAADAPPGMAPAAPELPSVRVVDEGAVASAQPSTGLRVVALTAASGPTASWPAVELRESTGLLLPDPLDLAARTEGLGLHSSLAFLSDARFADVLRLAALRRTDEAREVALAATAEELGRWAHQGSLVPLARALLAAALPPPFTIARAPEGGGVGWVSLEGRPAPVGLLDVAPGDYRRIDGRVSLRLARVETPGVDPLDDAALARLGGRPFLEARPAPPATPTLLFAAALAAWLGAIWLTRAARRAWLPAALVALGLGLLLANLGVGREGTAPWAARLVFPAQSNGDRVASVARAAGVSLHTGMAPLACASGAWANPCTPLATLGLAAAPADGMDALLFERDAPRVDVLSVEAPREVTLGSAAQVWVTLRVRRAEGKHVRLSVRSTSAAPASQEVPVEGADMVRTVPLVLSPLSEGVAFLAVEASLPGEPQAQDGRLLALTTRARRRERLVLAAAPGWEARAAAEALSGQGAQVQVLNTLGLRAVVARGRAAQLPQEVLRAQDGLRGIDLVAVVGFDAHSVDGAAAAGLRRYVEAGGAALVLAAPGMAEAFGMVAPAASATPFQSLAGQLFQDSVRFQGYLPPASLQLPPGVAVLGRLAPSRESVSRPWVVGRAFGKGRVAVVTAPDFWRLSPPGQASEAYRKLLLGVVGWLEAPAASRGGVVLAEDWTALQLPGASGVRTLPLPTAGTVDGLSVDPVDVATFIPWPRARLRAAAAAARHPFLELEGVEALAAAWSRLPPVPRGRSRLPLRASDAVWGVLVALLALEAMARRLYGGSGGMGSRANTAASSEDTGGTVSGEAPSARASAMPAARAAARRAGPSTAA